MLNKVVLIGRLTADPELRYTPSGTAVCNFTLAVERNFRNKDGDYDADFIDIVVWRKQAENCANYLAKGRLTAVEGRLQKRSYETDQGQRRYISEIVANNVQFLDYGNNNNNNNGSNKQNSNQNANQNQQKSKEEDIDVPF